MDAVLKNHQDQLAQKTIETLTSTYGFDPVRCTEAVEAIGDKGDVETAIGWLLDHGEEDRGGSIALKRCPHLDCTLQPHRRCCACHLAHRFLRMWQILNSHSSARNSFDLDSRASAAARAERTGCASIVE